MDFSKTVIVIAVLAVGVIEGVDSQDVSACKDNTCPNIPALGCVKIFNNNND